MFPFFPTISSLLVLWAIALEVALFGRQPQKREEVVRYISTKRRTIALVVTAALVAFLLTTIVFGVPEWYGASFLLMLCFGIALAVAIVVSAKRHRLRPSLSLLFLAVVFSLNSTMMWSWQELQLWFFVMLLVVLIVTVQANKFQPIDQTMVRAGNRAAQWEWHLRSCALMYIIVHFTVMYAVSYSGNELFPPLAVLFAPFALIGIVINALSVFRTKKYPSAPVASPSPTKAPRS